MERQLAGLAGGFMRMRGESGGSGGWLRTRQERCGDGDAGGAAEASPGPQAQAGRAVRTWGRSSGQGLGRGGGVESDPHGAFGVWGGRAHGVSPDRRGGRGGVRIRCGSQHCGNARRGWGWGVAPQGFLSLALGFFIPPGTRPWKATSFPLSQPTSLLRRPPSPLERGLCSYCHLHVPHASVPAVWLPPPGPLLSFSPKFI